MNIILMKRFLGVAIISLVAFSCSKESEINEPTLESVKSQSQTTSCDVKGTTIVIPGNSYTYSYSNDFNASSITWTTVGSGMTITSGQNTSIVTVQLSSGFSNGMIKANGINGNQSCMDFLNLVECTAPSSVQIVQDEESGNCPGTSIYFDADLFGGNLTSGSYQWTAGNGASVQSGNGTSRVRVLAPSSGGFSISVTFTSDCSSQTVSNTTLGLYDGDCGGGGPSPF